MTLSDKTEYIRYRLETAYTTFEAARVLADNGFWNSVTLYFMPSVLCWFFMIFKQENIHH